ncbi:hypothetical protein EQ500_07880, partial [Lactobacillus sp. XV13L]|nr:hypothetical protein [Lactobacillus sp. XV13L]
MKKFPFSHYVRMKSPYSDDSRLVYHFFVDVQNVPENIPTEINPRDVNTKKQVYKKIVNGLTSGNESFFVNNRGI